MENVFETNPVRVVVYDPLSKSHIANMLFIGDVPRDIITEVNSAIKNKTRKYPVLEKFYGANWARKLGIELETIGGDDDMDIFDIGEITGVPKISVNAPKPKQITAQEDVLVISDYYIYPDDRITEFKYKIYAATHKHWTPIPIHYQHIFCYSGRIIPISYQIDIDNPVTVNILNSYASIEKTGNIMGFPIDHEIYPAKNMIRISSSDHTQTLGDLYRNTGTSTFYIVNFGFIMSQHLPILRELLRTDRVQIELLYYSFIIKFWPAITLELFEMIITNTDISKTYPDLYPSLSKLNAQLVRESEILNAKYSIIKKMDAGKYSFDPTKISSQSLIMCNIKSATLSVSSIVPIVLNPREVFDSFELCEQVPIIKIRINIAGTETVITKIKESVPGIQSLYNLCKYKMQLLSTNSVLLVMRTSKDVDQFLVIVIRSNGNYIVRSIWNNSTNITFDNIRSYIQKNVNPLITQLNSMSRSIFSTQNTLPEITFNNSVFSELNIDIIWKKSLTDINFEFLKREINADIEDRILKMKSEDAPEIFNTNVLIFNAYKSICDVDPNIITQYYKVPNYYYYLIESKAKQKWQRIFDSGKQVILTRRTTDVKFEVNNFRESEFIYFYTYLSTRLYSIKSRFDKSAAPILHKPTKSNNLKILKERDPELFKFKVEDSNMVYSRLVQKSHQPVMYTPSEYDILPAKIKESAVKYWNFTSQSPVYYHCPNPKNPYLNFITDYHPKKYCLPKCCKVRAIANAKENKYNSKYARDPVTSKKCSIYNTCIQNHIYSSEAAELVKSRYIMNYKKALDYNRISYLPDIVVNYFMYNSNEQVVTQSQNFINYTFSPDAPQKIYSVRELWRLTKNNKVYSVPISEFISDLSTKSWSYQSEEAPDFAPMDIIKNPNLSSTHYSRILNSDVRFPILVYKHAVSDQKKILDGLHRLAKQYITYKNTDKMTYVNVKYVTQNQLQKSEVSDNQEIDEYYQQAYYIYGSSQNLPAVSNVGAIFAISDSISMSTSDFITSCINKLKQTSSIDYFKCLLNGVLLKYFTDIKALLGAMNELVVSKKPIEITSTFNMWNELFIDILKYCFGIMTIIINDSTLDNAGTDIQLIINSKIQHVSDIIPNHKDNLEITRQFIVLMRKTHRTITSDIEYMYYPVFKLTPKEFFKSSTIAMRIHTQDDTIIKILRQLLDRNLDHRNTSSELNLDSLVAFINANKEYRLISLYVTRSNMCYAVKIKKGNTTLVISIAYSIYNDLVLIDSNKKIRSDIDIINEPMLRKNVHQSYSDLQAFIVSYNEFVHSRAKANMKFDIDNPGNITYSLAPIKIDNILSLLKSGMIIGMVCNNMRYYFEPVKNDKVELLKFIKSTSAANLFRSELTPEYAKSLITYLRYDPDTINLAIYEHDTKPESAPLELLAEATYERHKYQNFCLTIFNKLDQETNVKTRTKIEDLLRATNFDDHTEYKQFTDTLSNLIDNEDVETIKTLILEYTNVHYNRKILISNFNSLTYQFDKKTLNKLKKYSNRDTHNANELYTIVSNLCAPLFHIANIEFDGVVNSEPCYLLKKKSAYCKDSKMVLDKKSLENLISVFIADLCNPLKRQYLLSAIYNRYLTSDLRLKKNHDEQIYIRV